jgi:hypothetical protein
MARTQSAVLLAVLMGRTNPRPDIALVKCYSLR